MYLFVALFFRPFDYLTCLTTQLIVQGKVFLQAFYRCTHFLLTLLLSAKVAVRTERGSLVHLLAVQWRLTSINDPSMMVNKQLYDLLCESTRQLYYTRVYNEMQVASVDKELKHFSEKVTKLNKKKHMDALQTSIASLYMVE